MRPRVSVRRDLLLLAGLAALAHGVNMFVYPALTLADDEGTYLEQAWAVLREGRLAPYTYTYDHVPGGWIQIAGWLALVGPRAFGSVADTARVFMLALHVASVVLLYVAARRLAVSRPAAVVACVAFAASPLVLFYGREAILENVMSFWLIASLALVSTGRVPGLVLGGFALGVAILSKEPALVLVPAYALLGPLARARSSARRAVAMVAAPAIAIAAAYPAYAVLQGEFWPSAVVALKATDPRAYAGSTLIDSVLWQLGRPGGNPFDPASELRIALGDWLRRDAILVIGGLAASIRNTYPNGHRTRRTVIGILGLCSVGFLVRGGIVYPFHVGLALPFLALNLGVAVADLLPRVRLPAYLAPRWPAVAIASLFVFWTASGALPRLYLDHPGEAARDATAWIQHAVPPGAVVVGRDDLWADLHEPDAGGHAFARYHTHWRMAYDDAARSAVMTSGWRSIQYVVVSRSLMDGLRHTTHDPELSRALQNAELVASFIGPTSDAGLHPREVIEVWAVDDGASAERPRTRCVETRSIVCPR